MSRTTRARRVAAALTLLATTLGGAVALAGTTAGGATAAPAPQRTVLTFAVPGCDGCTIQLHQGLATDDPDEPRLWTSRAKEVEDGKVRFSVPSKRTAGMSVSVEAPWEGHTGYTTTVAFRYAGEGVGDQVTFREARGKKRASACWEGTRRDRLTVPLVVREVMVDGVHERVAGSIAFVRTTQSWLDPVRRAPRGVLGSQDVDVCG